MSIEAEMPELKRVSFFNGQRLTATDLNDLRISQQELRWLHNRSLHNWGIGLGLNVSGDKGDRQVTVAPGYGIDCLGREIVLLEPDIQAVPPVAGGIDGKEAVYYLVANYANDFELPAEERQGVCPKNSSGAVRFPERPRFAWRTIDQISPGLDLILSQIWVLNCQLNQPVSLTPRRNARSAQQPYIFAGSTPAGNTAWEVWAEPLSENHPEPVFLGVKTIVDTSHARFHLTPRYLAHVGGARFIKRDQPNFFPPVDGFVHVSDSSPNHFVLQVLLPFDLRSNNHVLNPQTLFEPANVNNTLKALQSHLQWHVVWLGVEG
ncbi:MAG: hypothetical protein MUF72_15705 [Elainella sp. Prado103]|jgi:hypothetical protein|nr:hypothetical protein [Elainella sp. Prado103]